MATRKGKVKADAPVEIREASQKGLKGFDDKAISDSIISAHKQALVEGKAAEAKAAAAFAVCVIAAKLRESKDNRNLADEAFTSGWRYSMRGLYPRLHAAQVSWVEQSRSKDKEGNEKVSYKLSAYGKNISSDAQQAAIYLTSATVEESGSLMAVRKAIRNRKQELADAEMTDEQRDCQRLHAEIKQAVDAILAGLAEIESPKAYLEVAEMLLPVAEYVAAGNDETEEAEAQAESA